jgi:hypothetical protein
LLMVFVLIAPVTTFSCQLMLAVVTGHSLRQPLHAHPAAWDATARISETCLRYYMLRRIGDHEISLNVYLVLDMTTIYMPHACAMCSQPWTGALRPDYWIPPWPNCLKLDARRSTAFNILQLTRPRSNKSPPSPQKYSASCTVDSQDATCVQQKPAILYSDAPSTASLRTEHYQTVISTGRREFQIHHPAPQIKPWW